MSNVRAAHSANPTWNCTTAQLCRVLAGITGLPESTTAGLAAEVQQAGEAGEIRFTTETRLTTDGAAKLGSSTQWTVRRIHEIGRDYRIIRSAHRPTA
jgi:hypothetical protein